MHGLWAEAANHWQKAVELDPTYAAAWNNLGIAYEQQGQFNKARNGVRKSAAARAQQQLHSTELRSVQGNL